jgi:hypothetical protein
MPATMPEPTAATGAPKPSGPSTATAKPHGTTPRSKHAAKPPSSGAAEPGDDIPATRE